MKKINLGALIFLTMGSLLFTSFSPVFADEIEKPSDSIKFTEASQLNKGNEPNRSEKAIDWAWIPDYRTYAQFPKSITAHGLTDMMGLVFNLVNPFAGTFITHQEFVNHYYPNLTAEQIEQTQLDEYQVAEYFKIKGAKNTQLKEGVLDMDTLKSEIKAGRPVVAFMHNNGDYWFEADIPIVIWGYQVGENADGSKTTVLMTWCYTHNNPIMTSDIGYDNVRILETDYDPEGMSSTYTWANTLYGFNFEQ